MIFKNRLVKTYDPIAIYLFGSYTWGAPSEESGLDLVTKTCPMYCLGQS